MSRIPRLALLAFLTASLGAVDAANGQEGRFGSRLVVIRVVLTTRAVDRHGQTILGLQPADFRVAVDGEAVPVESVEWVPGGTVPEEVVPRSAAGAVGERPAPAGRLVVLFFQNDFGLSRERLVGLMRMAPRARRFVDSLTARDLVAVLSFDSHLKLHLDFTADRARLDATIAPRALLGRPAAIEAGPSPSLAAGFDRAAALRAATPERALLVTARALRGLPGPKSLVLLGWGLGHLSPSGTVHEDRDYEPARRELLAAGVTVFSLDVTDADYHSLEVGLEQVALDTGGFYAKTNLFPDLAMARLDGALQGHYVLVFERPATRGPGVVEVSLVGVRGTVLTRSALD